MRVVTAFFDLGRSNYRNHARSADAYVRDFLNGIAQLDADIAIFANQAAKATLESALEKTKTLARITIIEVELEELPLAKIEGALVDVLAGSAMRFYSLRDGLLPLRKYISLFWKVFLLRMSATRSTIWDEIAAQRPRAPEYTHWEYLVLTWSKPWFIGQAFERGLVAEDSLALWADFGLGHSSAKFRQMVEGKKLHENFLSSDSVHLSQRGGTRRPKIRNPWDAAELWDDAVVPAGVLASGYKACQKLDKFFSDQIYFWLASGIAPDDQVLLAMFEAKYPDWVNLLPPSNNHQGWYQLEHFLET